MYRSDKQFMKNPATAPMRIYVGNLADSVQPANLDEKFSNHGRILGLIVQRGFGFVQFETEQQAQNAIKNEHGMMFHGRKLNVKQAIDNAKSRSQLMASKPQGGPPFNQQNQNQGPPPQQQQQQQQQPPQQQQQPQQQKPPPAKKDEPEKEPEKESPQKTPTPQPTPPKPNNQPASNNGPSPQQPSPQQNNNNATPQDKQPPPAVKAESNMPPKVNKDDNGPPPEKKIKRNRPNREARQMKHNFRDDYREDYRDDMGSYYEPPVPPAYGAPNYHPPVMERPERNDCEIIVVSKPLTEYAEYIEQRLKTLGLIVDLLFPNEDVPIGRVLANISSRGCLFSILVMPQNEEHRSLTLNILHGVPEEHRNMPVEDAFILITRNFEAYMRGEKFGDKSESNKMSLTMRHPEHVQVVLNLLAENRQISSSQYTKIIDYLQKKQELQTEFEVAEGIDGGVEPEVKGKQAELQSRIMNILNKKGEEVVPEKEQKAPAPLLNDPSVQKALDSLLSGDMFKGLSS